MRTGFKKLPGDPALSLAFVWQLTIETDEPLVLTETLIPELFFDFLLTRKGKLDSPAGPLPAQSLRTLHTGPIAITYTAPLVIYGARFSLAFAEDRQAGPLPADAFLARDWLPAVPVSLEAFRDALLPALQKLPERRDAPPLLTPELQETGNFKAYSARHKRRLYKRIFGVSRQEMRAIHNVHAFLAQTCDFSEDNPRIIEYVNADRFYDQPHLNHMFKKLTGQTPLEYFDAGGLLQDNLMSASYKAIPAWSDTMELR